MQIYLDYSATTPCHPEVISTVQLVLSEHWGNPSSLHVWGERAAWVLEQARMQVADLIQAPLESIVFTSGGTESNNLALHGVASRFEQPQHLIISGVEHSSISNAAQQLAQGGWQVTCLPVDPQGRVQPLALQRALRSNTVLVSVIYGQSEVGTLQPIPALAEIAHRHGAYFHTDAVQAAGRIRLDVQALGVDLLSLSSHKFYGSQGAGALYVRPGLDLVPLLAGGGQEGNLRSGTPGLPAIAAMGHAAHLAAQNLAAESVRLTALRDRLYGRLADNLLLVPTGDPQQRLPHHLSFWVRWPQTGRRSSQPPLSGKAVVRQMNLAGIAISSGSACHSGKLTPSPVLLAMGLSETAASAGLRITLGRETTEADLDWTAMVLEQVLTRLTESKIPAAV
ncbi:aminotransferase class V-fold PLP-dependent enzyme [Synechococcales cyanobacterium C]|uniref:cysteine desulfurase n=1 Tax=Petrachloros mirabilis ULC683 TaxID=2781853 RepID=A0A8K1ZZJ7_9CYAN|nr:cysteine desulfurase family protein [Petrachloros mirabilis]NCJ06988.1 aminotransferase class V-fold PLP-dependent enzyme [Petrachloros mirabilis ULC683]